MNSFAEKSLNGQQNLENVTSLFDSLFLQFFNYICNSKEDRSQLCLTALTVSSLIHIYITTCGGAANVCVAG